MICGKGCGKCCHVEGTDKILMTTVGEALNIARVTGREMNTSAGRLLHRVRTDITRAAPCPFLKNEMCTIYEHRPAVCRAYDCDRTDPWVKSPDSVKACRDLAADTLGLPVADLRNWFPEPIEDALARHTRIAFQFSGGKDSTALLLRMGPYWPLLTVYHLNTGDQHPETTALVKWINDDFTPVTIIQSDVFAVKAAHGLPSDVVPWASSQMAHSANVGVFPMIQDRVSCCYHTVMAPLHERMIRDGITLIIRGQKNRDSMKGDLQSGDCTEGMEFLFPLSDMTDDDCFRILKEKYIPIPSYYAQGLVHSGDCLGCTAWTTEEARPQHLREFFPERYRAYRQDVLAIANAADQATRGLFRTANDCLENE